MAHDSRPVYYTESITNLFDNQIETVTVTAGSRIMIYENDQNTRYRKIRTSLRSNNQRIWNIVFEDVLPSSYAWEEKTNETETNTGLSHVFDASEHFRIYIANDSDVDGVYIRSIVVGYV